MDIVLPLNLIDHYKASLNSFLYWLEEEGTPVDNAIFDQNLSFGQEILKADFMGGDREFNLLQQGYKVCLEVPVSEFEDSITSKLEFMDAIAKGRIFVWHSSDFQTLVVATKDYTISEVIFDLVH